MCGICGCDTDDLKSSHEHKHDHEHEVIHIEQNLLAINNQFAAINRDYFLKHMITAHNLMSSPGSGKTTLLARTIAELQPHINMAVVVGDQQTDYDAQQLKAAGANAIQVNTGRVCHLDAHMVGHSIESLALNERSILFIENIGNLVCPSLFDLGEAFKIVLLSVTEGDNKPLKYPDMFRQANLMIVTKIDLLPYVTFDINQAIEYARRINPSISVLSLSATTGAGLSQWYNWLHDACEKTLHEH